MSLISVIITTYNRANIVGQTIQSILNQTYVNFELLIVDDGSTDNTEEIINSFKDKRIKYIKTDNWGGPARPRNIGIKHTKGAYIAFCDDDDIWIENKLEEQIKHLNDNQIIGVASRVIPFGGNTKPYRSNYSHKIQYLDLETAMQSNIVALSSLIIKNINDSFFDENRLLIAYEDWDFQLNILSKSQKKILLLPNQLVYYRIHDQNISTYTRNHETSLLILDKYFNFISLNGYKNAISNVYYRKGMSELKQFSDTNPSKYFIKAFLNSKSMKLRMKSLLMNIFSYLPKPIQKKLIFYYCKQ